MKEKWKWLNRMFNGEGLGKVCLELDRKSEGDIKSMVVGEKRRLLMGSGIDIEELSGVKWVVKGGNEESNWMKSGLVYGIEVVGEVGGDEVVVSVLKGSCEIIGMEGGSVLVEVLDLLCYDRVGEKE